MRKNNNGNIMVTPRSPPSSIRGSARVATISGIDGQQTQKGTFFNVDHIIDQVRQRRQVQRQEDNFVDRLARTILPFSPVAGAPGSTNLMEDDAVLNEAQRFCYCDDVEGDAKDEDWIECSSCKQWYHLLCTGWKREEDNGCQYLVAPFGHQVLLDGSSDNPWFCIRCWERQKALCLEVTIFLIPTVLPHLILLVFFLARSKIKFQECCFKLRRRIEYILVKLI